MPFHDIDPYEVLQVPTSATPVEIKKSYKKLCLKHHPDKVQQQQVTKDGETDAEDSNKTFARLQFAYSILSDPARRQRFDNTGSLSELEVDLDSFDWKDYFKGINEKITLDMIEEDRMKYQGSQEERDDIWHNFIYYEGDFLYLFEVIPHLEFTEEEENRVFNIIEDELASSESQVDKTTLTSWGKYKKSRQTKVRAMLKKLAKEAKEAAKLQKEMTAKHSKKISSEADLKLLIQSRQASRMDDLISSLEMKYGKGSKRLTKDISDDEFERIQSGLKRPKTKRVKTAK